MAFHNDSLTKNMRFLMMNTNKQKQYNLKTKIPANKQGFCLSILVDQLTG